MSNEKKTQKPQPNAQAQVIARLTDELTVAKDLAQVRMKRIESLQRELESREAERQQQVSDFITQLQNARVERDAVISDRDHLHERLGKANDELTRLRAEFKSASSLRLTHSTAQVVASEDIHAAPLRDRITVLEAFVKKSLHEGQINCTEASELLGEK